MYYNVNVPLEQQYAICHVSPELSTNPIEGGSGNDRVVFYNAVADGAIANCYNALSPGTRAKIYFQAVTYIPNDPGSVRISDANAPYQYVYLERPEECSIIPSTNTKEGIFSFSFLFIIVTGFIKVLKIFNSNRNER